MGLIGSVDRMRDSFDAQFEVAADGKYLYRRNQKGEPMSVTADERERFIRQYVRRIWFVLLGMMAGLVILWGVIIWWSVSNGVDLPDVALYVSSGVAVVIATVLMYWVRGAPARELEDRTPIGRERSGEEMRAIYLSKTSYRQLGAAGAFGAFLILFRGIRDHSHPGWHWFYLLLGGALIVFAAVRAIQKWRFDSERGSDVR
jgi:hypothetical protein